MATRRVVAVQLRAVPGAVEANLRHIADLVREAAREHDPDMVFLPEAATAPNICHRMMRGCARPVAGEPLEVVRRLAREHGCAVGFGALAIRGRDVRNTYYLAEPDGTVHLHDKDQPSIWENNYYAGGHDDGVLETVHGAIGCANGFEWARGRTAARLRGRVRLVAGGMCFPSYPRWALTRPYLWRREHATMLQLARETPGRMARLVGVPAVHPSHVGDVTMQTPMAAPIPWPTVMVGETQITDADGAILRRLAYADGEGYVCADVAWEPGRPRDPLPPGLWTTTIPASLHAVWVLGNAQGAAKYRALRALGRHPWQHAAGYGEDVPDRIPAPDAVASAA